MMKKYGVLLISALLIAASAQASFTVATFANPSTGSQDPLFYVDWTNGIVTGGWADGKGGLTLELTAEGMSYSDVWFEMTQVSIDSQILPGVYGYTGAGTISFYAAGDNANPLFVIDFASGVVNNFVFGSEDAAFSGAALTGAYDEEQFSFAFAAKKSLNGGFTATAAFDASAIPEPATLAIFGMGAALTVGLRKKRS